MAEPNGRTNLAGRRGNLGYQPFHVMIRDDGRNLAWLSRTLDVPYTYVANVAHGYTAPSHEFRRQVSGLLRRPVKDLFTPEALAAEYVPRRNSIAPLNARDRGGR